MFPFPECGGMFKVRASTFTSPKYPNNYDSDLYCEWFLEVEDNHRLSLSFDDFSIENSCEHDYVKVILILCVPSNIHNIYDQIMMFCRFTTDSIRQTINLWPLFVVMKFQKQFTMLLTIEC